MSCGILGMLDLGGKSVLQRALVFRLAIWIIPLYLRMSSEARKIDKSHSYWKGSNKYIIISRYYDCVCKKSKRIYTEMITLICEFNKVIEHKITTKIILLLNTSNKQIDNEIFKNLFIMA